MTSGFSTLQLLTPLPSSLWGDPEISRQIQEEASLAPLISSQLEEEPPEVPDVSISKSVQNRFRIDLKVIYNDFYVSHQMKPQILSLFLQSPTPIAIHIIRLSMFKAFYSFP
jgi:hypothetical protein